MLRLLRPEQYLTNIYDLPVAELAQTGFRGIILDLDNTLVAWDTPAPDEQLLNWLDQLKASGFRICILSNNRHQRVQLFSEKAGVKFVAKAGKPGRRSYRQALSILNTRPAETIAVGDQLFTDVLGGNRCGIRTYLVRPIADREFIGTQIVRKFERLVLRQMKIAGGPGA